jgi:hypothetical protein
MLSPAPVAKKIADRSEGGSDDSSIDIIGKIAVIEAKSVTDLEDKKNQSDDSSDSSGTTITEEKESPETDGGSIKEAVEGSELPTGVDSKVGVSSNTSDDSSSDSSSTGGSSKSSDTDISSSDSSDSTRSLITYDSLDSDSLTASKANQNKMSSSMNKSSICDGERDLFEEWHSKWEVFGQDHRFDEYQCDIRHPDLPVDGHVSVTMTKDQKKALKKNKKAIASLRISLLQLILLMQ